MGHSEWVHWTLAGDVASFYEHLRWPGWEEESAALKPDQGFKVDPPPFTREGRLIADAGKQARADGRALEPPAGVHQRVRRLMRRRLPVALLFLGAGVLHFVKPGAYEPTVPDALPGHREIVYVSGVAELAGGLAMLHDRSARWAGWWLIALLVAVFPANVNMAVNAERFRSVPEALLWVRLPIQALLIAWVWRVSQPRERQLRIEEGAPPGTPATQAATGTASTSPRRAASACSRLVRLEISTMVRIAPRIAKPAPTVNAAWKPSVSAAGRALLAPPASAIASCVVEFAIVARIARPSAPPTCCEVLMSPLASPDSWAETPATAAIVSGTNTSPSPTAASSDGNSTSPT